MSWWINDLTRTFMSRGYLEPGQTVEERIAEIAASFGDLIDDQEIAKKFEEYLLAGYYSLSTPVWTNFGKSTGLPISCNGVYVGDSIADMVRAHSEVTMQTKHGAGTSGYFGDIRPSGTPVSGGFTADGPKHYMRYFDTTADVTSQGKARRGAFAAYLPLEHPDILEFLDIREPGDLIQHLHIGVTVTDRFMQEMEAGDNDKRKIWAKVLRKRKETGYPYIFFTDTVNREKPQALKDHSVPIHASNLCVAYWSEVDIKFNGEEMRLPIFDVDALFKLVNGVIEVKSFNEKTKEVEYKKITASAMTSSKAKVMRITDDETGKSITVTPDHKVYTKNRGYVMAKDLQPNDLLEHGKRVNKLLDALLHIEYLEEEIPVYDITVEDNHNFYAEDILVHNCSEIALPSSEEWSFVCCLASMNVYMYDEWKNTDAVRVMTYFLDAVMEEYIRKTDNLPYMEGSNRFARDWRAIGIGQLGWHSYLQKHMIAFESYEALTLTEEIARHIDDESLAASKEMAVRWGTPALLEDYGVRNLTRMAIAPTKSSSEIHGQVSPSVEPIVSNYFTKDRAKGVFTFKNPHLEATLERYGKNTPEVWESILKARGSVQHVKFLSDHERLVFKTFEEISPMAVIQQASVRQRYIDQSQSINLMFPHDLPAKEVNATIMNAWRMGVKTLYYQFSTNPSQELARSLFSADCAACEA